MGRHKVVNGRVQNIPQYDALSDPALANYWARKFGWTIATGAGGGAPQAGYGTSTDDGYAVGPGEDEYAITITTADEFGAGSTTCPKYITLNGRTASSDRLPLLGPETACRRGSTHTFYVVTHRVGVLNSIVLENEGLDKRDGWLCKAIMIQPMRVRKTYNFSCGKWLSRYEGDRLLELSLYPDSGPGLVEYELEVVTGDSKDAGTTDEVYITLHGIKDSSDRKLLGRQFPRGKKSVFVIRCAPLGRMQRLEVERGAKTADGWWLDKVVVTSLPNAKEKATFSWGKWPVFFSSKQTMPTPLHSTGIELARSRPDGGGAISVPSRSRQRATSQATSATYADNCALSIFDDVTTARSTGSPPSVAMA